MHRKFIALIIASALAITTLSAAPARASDDDAAKFLAGFLALALIGAAIKNSRDNDAPVVSRATPPRHPRVHPRPVPVQPARYVLPGQCLRNYSFFGGPKRLLGLRCLQNRYRYTASLPYACRVQINAGRVTRTGYEPLCLRERGYRIARY